MAQHLKFFKNPNFFHIQIGGSMQPEGIQQFFFQIPGTARNAGLQKLLVDVLTAEGNLTTLQRFEFGSMLAEHFHGLQVAFIVNEPMRAHDLFGETVAVNRGANIRVFTDIEDAQRWLGIPQVDQTAFESI